MKIKKTFLILVCLTLLIGAAVACFLFNRGTGEIILNERVIGDIDVTEHYLNNNKKKPLVILQHGVKGTKKDVLQYSDTLVNQGYFVVMIDAFAHGDRAEQKNETGNMIDIIETTSSDYNSILSYYKNESDADPANLYLIGFSMGGFITYHYAMHGDYPVKAFSPICSTSDWESMIDKNDVYILMNDPETGQIRSWEEKAAIDQFLTENSPLNNLEKFENCNILIQNGKDDQLISYIGSETFYNQTQQFPTIVEFNLIENQYHELTADNIVNASNFFKQFNN